MEIILLEKISNLGDVGAMVKVRNGYARNFLIPKKKAMLATEDAKLKIEEKRKQLAKEEAARLKAAEQRAAAIVRHLVIKQQSSEEGTLYGSVSPADIAAALVEQGSEVEKSEIQSSDSIKEVGEFDVDVILHPEVRFTLKVVVESENWDKIKPKSVTDDQPEISEDVVVENIEDIEDSAEMATGEAAEKTE